MRPFHLTLLAAIAGPAHAARHEISFDHELQPALPYEVEEIYGGPQQDAFGVRAGVAVLKDQHRLGLTITAGWRRAVRGQTLEVWAEEEDGTFAVSTTAVAALVSDTFSVGVKGDVDVGNIWYPYVAARAELVRASSKLDGAADRDDNPTQVATQALAPAGTFVAGFELMLPDRKLDWPVVPAIYAEAGYQVAGDLKLGALGDLPWGGAVIGMGVGLRF